MKEVLEQSATIRVEISAGVTEFDSCQVYDFIIAKPANTWVQEASLRTEPRKLFYELWYEGELVILFATSGAGKSILACQIGNELSATQKVLYLDCELSDKQFQIRYSNSTGNQFRFNENFIRLELNTDAEKPDKLTEDDYLLHSIEQCVVSTGAKILIIDNITYLRSDTEKSKDVLPLMKKLKSLKKKYDLSLLILAHTPKRDASKPITENDLYGSVMQKNFCDSMFAIGTSTTDASLRYLKQIKERSTPKIYDEDNVIVYQIEKDDCFLGFTFLQYGKESDYLKPVTEPSKKEMEERVFELHSLGKSLREIGREMNISLGKVQRIIKKMTDTVIQ